MNYKIEIIGLFFSSLLAITFWRILIVPLGFLIAVIIGIIFFLAYRYIISEEKKVNYYPPSLRFKKALFSCLVVLSILVVWFVHPISEVEFVAWNVIPMLNLLRLVLSSFLTLFSPGYMILNLMDKNEKLTGTEKVFFSMGLSLFLLPFLGCLSFALASNILQLGIPSIIILNLALLIPYIFFKRNKSEINEKVYFNLNEKLLLVALLIFMTALMLSKYSLNLTWEYGDLDTYYGFSVSFTKDVFPLSPIGPGLNYPFWPFIFLAEFFILSGVPCVNAFQFISIPITFLPILSFYIMTSAFFKEQRYKKIPIVATILGFFSGGFGWIFGVYLLSNNQTVQSLYELFGITARTNSGYLIPAFYSAGIYPLYTYALTSIFALIWLIYSNSATKIGNLRYAFISLMIALGYLAHVAEIVFFILIFLTSILIFRRENISSYRKCAVSIIFGLLLIALPDIIVGGSYYTAGSAFAYYGFSLYYGTIVLATLALFLSFIKGHLKTPAVDLKMSHNTIRALKIACSGFIIYFYGLCLIIWSKVFETYNSLPTESHTVPWYAWPNRLGLCGLIALPGIIYLIYKSKSIKDYSFFVLLVPVSFIIARILHVVPSFYYEDRLTFLIMIPAVILASFVLLKFGQSLKKHAGNNVKNIVLGSALSTILVLGFLPGLLTTEAFDLNYWSKGEKLTSLELDALNFLRLNTPSNCSVLTLTTRSKRLLSYAGLSPAQTYINTDPSLIFASSLYETALYSLMKSQLKYVYLTSADKKELEQNPDYSGFVKNFLLKYLSIAFQNEEVTIYKIPEFSNPINSNTAIVTPNINIGYFTDIFDQSDDKYLRFSSISTTGDIITIKTDNQSQNHDFELPVNINPKEYSYLAIRWKTDGSKLYFYLLGSTTIYYTLLGSSTSWQTTVINLDDFYDVVRNETVGIKLGEQVISVLFRNFKRNSEYSLDYIQFFGSQDSDTLSNFFALSMIASAQTKYSAVIEDDPARFNCSALILTQDLNRWSEMEEQDFQRYLQWTYNGGRLIILDSSGTPLSAENRNLTLNDYFGWREENFTTDWVASECTASSNGTVVTVKVNNESKNHDFISPTINVTVGDYPYAVIRWKTDGSPLFFYPHGTESNYRYIKLGASTDWTTTIINLKDFYDIVLKNNTSFNYEEQIDKSLFRSFTKNATYLVDCVRFYKTYPLPIYPGFANLLSLYTEGKSEADGIKSQTLSLNFPSVISVPLLHSDDMNTQIAANYTINGEPISPYALTKKIGKGELIYLAVSPYFSQLKNSTDERAKDLFSDIGSLLNVLALSWNKNTVKWTNYFPQFDFIKEPVNFTGKIVVDTDYIQLPKLNAACITILSNNETIKTINLNNSIIEKIEYTYPVKFRIFASEAHLSGSSLGSYLNIRIIGDFNLTMEIPKNNTVTISMWNNSTLWNETFQDNVIQLGFTNNPVASVLVKNPTITTEGDAFFNKARIYRNDYKLPLFYNDGTNPFEVIGKTTFKIEYSDNGIIFVDGFIFNGKWFYPTTEQKQPSFTEMDIPWFNVLTSPFHILLVTVICAFSIAYTYLALKRVKIRTKLKSR